MTKRLIWISPSAQDTATHSAWGGGPTEKKRSSPNSWAAHRKPIVKGERGKTLTQSQHLYQATEIVIPVSSSTLLGILERNIFILTTPRYWLGPLLPFSLLQTWIKQCRCFVSDQAFLAFCYCFLPLFAYPRYIVLFATIFQKHLMK